MVHYAIEVGLIHEMCSTQ
uniref:Uncharacterized protein n=1 Tax=Arundo donax TaxID=35708 RepID=A0A0A9BQT2_ARUDO